MFGIYLWAGIGVIFIGLTALVRFLVARNNYLEEKNNESTTIIKQREKTDKAVREVTRRLNEKFNKEDLSKRNHFDNDF